MKKITIDFQKGNGLIPVIIQDYLTNQILMLGYMNETAWNKTNTTGWVYFWSRSRQSLWQKGETSGNKLAVKAIAIDCDFDTLLIKAKITGSGVCHTGNYSCFFNNIK